MKSRHISFYLFVGCVLVLNLLVPSLDKSSLDRVIIQFHIREPILSARVVHNDFEMIVSLFFIFRLCLPLTEQSLICLM